MAKGGKYTIKNVGQSPEANVWWLGTGWIWIIRVLDKLADSILADPPWVEWLNAGKRNSNYFSNSFYSYLPN